MLVELSVAYPDGHTGTVRIDSPDTSLAVRSVVARGYRVLSVTEVAAPSPPESRATKFSLVLFSQELLALLEAGLTLVEALEALRSKEGQTGHAAVLDGVLNELREGKRFSDALSAQPQQFNELYCATMRAAERSGNLADTLSRYITYRVQFDTIRKKLISVSLYPVMLLGVGTMVTLFLLGYVVPRFSTVFEDSGRPIPWLSAGLLAAGRMIDHHWLWIAPGIAALLLAGIYVIRTPHLRNKVLQCFLRLPALASRAAQFRLARFYRTVALLLNAGIPLATAMNMTSGLFPKNESMRLAQAKRAVEEGKSFSQALSQAALITPIALSLIRVGERSGRLADMLDRAARFQDEDLARWVDWTSRLLEPVLMTIIGIVIGSVVVLLYLPIFDLAETLQ